MIVKITFVSHILAAFRLVPQSCTSSTLLRRKTQTDSSSATLPSTIIVEPALMSKFCIKSLLPPAKLLIFFNNQLIPAGKISSACLCKKQRPSRAVVS